MTTISLFRGDWCERPVEGKEPLDPPQVILAQNKLTSPSELKHLCSSQKLEVKGEETDLRP